MRRKLAILTCIAVATAMLTACGGSSSSSSAAPEPAAEETTAETEVQEEAKEEAPAEEPQEAAEETTEAVEETAEAADTATAETPAADATAAEAAAADATAAAAADVQEGDLGATQMSQIASADLESITPMEEDKQTKVAEATEGEVEDKGFAFSNGEMYEYTAFKSPDSFDGEEYVLFYYDPVTNELQAMLDVCHFNKTSGVTADMLKNYDLSTLFPGFYDMPFAASMIYTYPDYTELIVGFVDLNKPDNIQMAKDYGLLILPNYVYGTTVDAKSLVRNFEARGYEEVSDYDLSKAGITP